MKYLIIFFCCCVGSSAICQSIMPWVLGSGGATLTDGEHTLTLTLGETGIQTLTDGQNILTLGFQQDIDIITSNDDLQKQIGLKVFPNPAWQRIQIQLEDARPLQWRLYDLQGVEIKKGLDPEVDVLGLASGMYMLRVEVEGEVPVVVGVVVR